MELESLRYIHNDNSTGSLLFVDKFFECYICEDGKRIPKIPGETRIPEGRYEILLRAEGGMNERYTKKFPFHRGMLHLQDVPQFTWIYIHIGNEPGHTDGCLLTGSSPNYCDDDVFKVLQSTAAYKSLYLQILFAIENNEKVFITIRDNLCLS